MRSHLQKLLALLLAALLLAGCSKAPETTAATEAEDVTGRYYLTATDGKVLPVLNERAYLRLKDDGKAIYELTYDQLEYKWKLKDDGTLTLTLDGEKVKGTLADGVISIRLDGRDRIFVKGKNAAQRYIDEHADTVLIPPTETTEGIPTAASTEKPAETSTEAPAPATTEAPATTQAPAESSAEAESTEKPGPFDPDIRFTGTDQYGNTVNEQIFRDYVVTMINFWEPWCGPCVGEMPELEQLYQDREGELLILGVYWTEDGAAEVLSETGVTYPVILYDAVFERYQTGYVPTTIFVDPGGHVIGQSYIGSRSYDEWAAVIKTLIGK